MNKTRFGSVVCVVLWFASPVWAGECFPGDGDGDTDADLADYRLLQICYTGGGGAVGPDCADFDFDGDQDVDIDDVVSFLAVVSGPAAKIDYGPSPRPDAEAEQLALENGQTLLAGDELYERIVRDLTAIRKIQPAVDDVVHDPAWLPDAMIVAVTNGAQACAFEALNAYYQITELDFLFDLSGSTWYVARYPARLRIPLLITEYAALPEVSSAEPDFLIGTDDSIDIQMGTPENEGTWMYSFDDGFHDCFDGCDCHIFWTFEVDGDGQATELSMQCQGLPWCEFPPICGR